MNTLFGGVAGFPGNNLPGGVRILLNNDDGGAGGGDSNNAGDTGGDSTLSGWLAGAPKELVAEHPDLKEEFGEKKLGDFIRHHYEVKSRIKDLDRAIIPPGENATPEEIAAYREKMGIPADPNGYEIPLDNIPEVMKQTDGENSMAEYNDLFKKMAAKAGLSKDQAKAMYAEFANMMVSTTNAVSNEQKRKSEAEYKAGEQAIRAQYGSEADAKMMAAHNLVKNVWTDEERSLLDTTGLGNNPLFIRPLIRIAEKMGEDPFNGRSEYSEPKGDGGLYFDNTPGMRLEDRK